MTNTVFHPSSEAAFIDWDESTFDEPMSRNAVTKSQKERYPDRFLKNSVAYTKVQLYILLREICIRLKNVYVCSRNFFVKEIRDRPGGCLYFIICFPENISVV